jgi:predicted nucleotidyltransferase
LDAEQPAFGPCPVPASTSGSSSLFGFDDQVARVYADKTFAEFSGADKERQLEEALMLEDPITEVTIAMEVNYFQLNGAAYVVPVAVKISTSIHHVSRSRIPSVNDRRPRSGHRAHPMHRLTRPVRQWPHMSRPLLDHAPVSALDTEPSVIGAYLFGSHATGRAHRESDVDLGVLLDTHLASTAGERFEIRLRLIAALGEAIGRNDVDLVVLNEAPPALAREIVTRGRRVYCRDAEADHAYRRTVMLRAADLEPFLRRTRAVKLDALRR